jgi:hypothetical protein
MQLSEHFTLDEFTTSKTAIRQGIDNTPDAKARLRLAYLCQSILEQIRQRIGYPIVITSGYRSPELNKAVGGAKNSQHMTGDAADIICNHTTMRHLWQTIELMVRNGEILVGQLIWEGGDASAPSWIHISNPREGKHNNEIIYAYF